MGISGPMSLPGVGISGPRFFQGVGISGPRFFLGMGISGTRSLPGVGGTHPHSTWDLGYNRIQWASGQYWSVVLFYYQSLTV